MDITMGYCVGTRPPPSCLILLLLKLLATVSQGLPGTRPLGFHFTHPVYNATVCENSAARTYVHSQGRMGITLIDLSWDVKYRIVSGDEEGFFKAEEVIIADFCFLRIRTKGGNSAILNREIQDNYLLIVKGSVRGEDLEAWTKVNIQVLDMNDLRPLFSPTTYSVTIAESTPLRTSVAQVTATDADIGSNGEFYYYFKNKVDLFSVHPTSGVISLSGRLNYDEKNRYDLEILAVDRGMKLYGNNGVSSTAKLYVHIERVNEHAPTIHVVTHVPFSLDKEPTYAVVTVDDLDEGANGEIESISIVAGDPLDQFFLAKEGKWMNEYKIKERKRVDWESFPYGYNLTLQAKDKGSPQKFSAAKIVHIANPQRDTVPVRFEKEMYDVSISEFSPPGVVVAIVKLSPEPLDVEYKLSPGEDAQYFKINPRSGLIVTAQPLNTIKKEVYKLGVTNKEGDLKAQVTVGIEDANDHTPEFQQPLYDVFVNESVPVGTNVLMVSASDKDKGENGYITYSIASLNLLPFAINQFTGVISTTEELDFESSPEIYRFIVRASDWGSPYRHESEVNVTIRIGNVNDNSPLFEKVACQGVISYDFPVGGHITAVSAIDIDELELVKYKIISGNELGFFYLNPDSGVLQLKKSLMNSGIKNGNFALRITATDGENFADPMSVNISVLHGKVSSKSFSCRETRVAQKLAEKLLIKAKANGKLSLEDGFLDFYSVNRQGPHFDKSFPSDVAVKENLPVGANILKIKAYDADTGFNGKVLFTISDGNTDSCFNIDMETGQLKVLLPMDREHTDLYLLNITIYDLGDPQKSSWRLLTINVEDANDNSPVFLQDSYSVNILESSSIGTEIIQVEARDKDLGSNGEVTYSVLTDTQQFAINSSTGIVYVADQLDRESKANYSLKIEARDKAESGQQLFSVVTLKVFLDDVNDCSPAFIPSSYSVKVLEDLPVGTVIAWLETHDPDLGLGGQVRYSLVNDYNGRFEIDKASGAIRLSKELDYEKQQFYNLTVRAKDKGRPVSLSSVSFVEVEVVDVNENLHTPYFPDFAVVGSVKENSRIGTSVLQVTAQDEDSGRDGEIQYSIRDGSGLGRFNIDDESGVISTADILDRETTGSYWLTVYATDRGVVPLYSTIEVYIEIEDVNDNAPLTSEPIYYPVVMENSPKDVSVIQIQAEDPDSSSNEKLTYRITSGNPQNFFAINTKTGLITTTSRKLDREQQAEHFLEVTVTDGGSSPKQSTIWVVVQVLDENDNKPQFPEKVYQIKLPERDRKKRGEPIYRAFAFDRDEGPNAEISYSIVDGNDDGKFFIDPKTGMVSSRKQFTAGSYDILTIKAVDNGRPQKSSTARLHIEWIKKPPPSPIPLTFDEPFYNFTVMESDRVTEIVGVVSVQPANTPLWFDIVGGNFDSSFDAEKGVGTIVIAKPLDAEQRSIYNMSVEVTDGTNVAVTQVFIKVLDNNDNGPEFSQLNYDVTISEDVLPDTEILQIEATDRDEKHKLTYTVHSSIDSVSMRKFRIDPSTGVLYTAERLDHEAQDKHILNIMVRDQEFPYRRNLARVIVNVEDANDHSPYFTNPLYEASVFESAALGSAVLQVTALDKDKGENAELIYTIEAGGNPRGRFALGLVQSEWKVYVKRPLDREEQDIYFLNITATDGLFVTQAMVEVTVSDVNDNNPVCDQVAYTALFPEDIPSNKIILKVSAKDADIGSNGDIRYSLYGSGNAEFFLDPESGELKTLALLDRERVPMYSLIARATDGGGRFCQSDIHLILEDVNDNPPVFSSDHYNTCVYENTATKALLTRVQAVDPDVGINRKVVYSLADSANGFFSIDSSSGIIILEQPLDREQQPSYNISVQATDQSPGQALSSLATVTITVLDINDNPPVFERRDYLVTVPEDTSPGTQVLAVFATSKDIGTNAEITYLIRSGNEQGRFRINPKTGGISVSEGLDYELCKKFYLVVEAKDGGTPALSAVATVSINLTDVNDNPPRFSQDVYSAVISEDALVGDSVILLVAEDADSQPNGQIRFSIVNGDRDNEFAVEPVLGLVKVKKKLDRERVSGYSLLVQAVDSGIPVMSSTATVNIDISDVNDNSPVFTPANYTAVIQENKPVGTSILQLVVTDRDSFHNGPPFSFSILSGNEEEEFVLDPHGILRSAVVFQHTESPEYVLCVQAKDSGKPQQVSHSYIRVRVIEESIHKPTAIPLEIYIVTMEDDFPGGVIGKIHATDQDMYDVLTFSLKSEQKSLFKVNSHDGKIIALGGLDSGKYVLNVSVSDGRFQVPIDVVVHVEQLVHEMLQNTVTIRFENVSPEDFVGLHMHGFRRTLRNAVLTQKQDSLRIISIQPVAGTNQLDMLFAVEMHSSEFYKPAYLIQKLSNARRHLENIMRISAILEKNCSGLDCQEQHCEQGLSLDSHALMTYSTARISFVCPRFYRNVRCTCNGGLCPGSNDPCMEKPCPGDMQCVGYEASRRPYLCQCPPGKLGECSGHTSLSFAGNSYIKYRLSENSKEEDFRLALRLRTLQSNGIIMYTRANPCLILKIVDGKLWFQLDCGNGPGILGISGRAVNDGSWHSVFLELNRNFTSLSLDDSYVERRRAPLYFQTLSTESTIYFGALVQADNIRSLTDTRVTQVLSGFQGCLDSVVLNNNELPLQNKRSSFAEVVGLTELKLGCVLYPDACERSPCQHGGSCSGLPSGGYQCTCLSQFTGRNCESEITACFPNPCQNGGSCDPIGNTFICNCKAGLTGVTCEEDVNECEREECENGGSCVNVFGSFVCNCTPGYVGQYCGLRPVVVPNIQAGHSYVGKEELIGIAVVLLVILVLVVLFVVFRKKVFRKNYSRNNITLVQDPATAALLHKSNGVPFRSLRAAGDARNVYQEVGPPQVPVRPMAYTPCFQGDSRSNLDKLVDGLGGEPQEMTTFHPESPRILTARRGVVVCSVAPNLPAVSPCRSDCDSIRKNGWDSGTDNKGVDDSGEVTCFAGSNKGSNSEVQSLSSFQSDSGDDNASIVTVIQLVNNVVDTIENEVSIMDQGQNYNRAYHWDTSDWMPGARLSDIEEVPNYENQEGGSAPQGSTRELESDYYLGGYDIDSEYPPPHEEEFLPQDQLPPPLPEDFPDQYEALPPSQPVSLAGTLSPDCRRRPQFHPSQYLPPHPFPNDTDLVGPPAACEFSTFAVSLNQGAETAGPADGVSLSLHNSRGTSSSDVSASCGFDDSEAAMSDYESVGELSLASLHIPFIETQHQTQV
ncbi:protocadherin Fat 3 isoform X3 [Canis aureus]